MFQVIFFKNHVVACTVSAISCCGMLALTGCATETHDAFNKIIIVRSSPSGAVVRVNDVSVGTTPTLAAVPREHHPSITVSEGSEVHKVDLETNYRWKDSFWHNMIYYVYAPIGWTVDYVTGTAWDPQDPPVQEFTKGHRTTEPKTKEHTIAIAPPLSGSASLSDTAAQDIESQLKQIYKSSNPPVKILPYEASLKVFVTHEYDFDGASDDEDNRRGIAFGLQADRVFHSNIENRNGELVLVGDVENQLTKSLSDHMEFNLTNQSDWGNYYTGKNHFFIGLPNTIGLDYTANTLTYNEPNSSITLKDDTDAPWWSQALELVGAINLQHVPRLREGRSGRWMFSLQPIIRVSRRQVIAQGDPNIAGQSFVRWYGAIGYGPEVGYQVGSTYLYVNFIPEGSWTQISWSKDQQGDSVTGTTLTTQTEFGCLYAFNPVWNLRFFARVQTEDTGLWQDAFHKVNPAFQFSSLDVAENVVAGLTLGYSFDSLLIHERLDRRIQNDAGRANK